MANADQPQIVRQWMLLRELSNRHYGVSLHEMAAEMGVVQRTIRRDLDKLKSLGFPIEEDHKSAHGKSHWKLAPNAKFLALNFNWDEAIALHLGQRHLDPLAGTFIWESLNRAFRKIRACLDDRALRHLDRMQGAFHHVQFGTSNYADKSDLIDSLSIAVEERWITLMTYQSLNATEPVEYEIAPYGIVFHRNSLYLVGYSSDHEEIRTFKIDRIEDAESRGWKFEPPADFDLQAHLSNSFGIFHSDGPPRKVRVRFAAGVARIVAESRWHPSQKLQHQSDGSLIAEFELCDFHEITSWILSFGSKANVLEPPELREEIVAELRQSLSQMESTPHDRDREWIRKRKAN